MGTKRKHGADPTIDEFEPIELNLAELRAEFDQQDDYTDEPVNQTAEDDEYTSKKAFAVYGKPNWSISQSVDDITAEEYLKRVKHQSKQYPSVFVSSIDPRQYDNLVDQSINQSVTMFLPPTPSVALPVREWHSQYISQFIEMRLMLSKYQSIHEPEPLPVKGPSAIQSAVESSEARISESNDQTTTQSSDAPTVLQMSVNQPIDQSVDQSVEQSIDQSVDQSTDQSINQSIVQQPITYYPHSRDLLGWLLHCTKQSRASMTHQSTDLSICQSAPHLHVINSFDQLTTRGLVDRLIDWFDNQTKAYREQPSNQTIHLPDKPFTEWMYCLFMHLSKPLLISQSVEMRRLYRICGEIRSEVGRMLEQSINRPIIQSVTEHANQTSDLSTVKTSDQPVDVSNNQSVKYAEIVMHCNMLMAVVSDVFGQSIPVKSVT